MALSLTKTISRTGTRPLINGYYYNRKGKSPNRTLVANQKKQFWEWFKARPELNSPVSARVNDTIVEVEFTGVDGSPLGRNKQLEAIRDWEINQMDERLKSVWFDAIVTGEAFGWEGKPSVDQLKEVIRRFSKNNSVKEALFKSLDEDVTVKRVFDYVASSTMETLYNDTTVTGYIQNVNGEERLFTPEEIIHFTFSRIDGRVEGYTPIASLGPELVLLWFIKENMMAYMRNQGLPRKVFSLPDEIANSKNHQFLIQQLETYGAVENRHGNLVLSGKIDVVDLEEKLRDMEYEDLALYITSNIAYALQIPVSRIPYMIGKAQSAGDAGGLAEAGYWSMIESDRRKIEALLNNQMYVKRGYKVRFKRKFTVEKMREVQGWSMRADAVTKVDSILSKFGKRLADEKLYELLEIKDFEVKDDPERAAMSIQKTGLRNQNLLNNQDLAKDSPSQRRANARAEAVNNPKGLAQDGN